MVRVMLSSVGEDSEKAKRDGEVRIEDRTDCAPRTDRDMMAYIVYDEDCVI